MSIDYSIVLNLHNEAPYLKRTLRSLAQAARFANYKGLTSELVMVLDSADARTREWVGKADYSDFAAYQILEVNNRSLGLSRNDGIAAASGEYITLADGDDIISYNFLVSMYEALIEHGTNTIVCPNHVCSFGDQTYWGKYTPIEDVTKIMLFGANPYGSRIGCHKSVLTKVPFADARGGLKAYEDWHFNCEAVAAGFRFDVAKDTILFYRQRRNSMMTKSRGRVIPFSRLFMPQMFVQRCTADYEFINGRRWFDLNSNYLHHQLLSSDLILELMAAANEIEPKIDFELIRNVKVGFAKAGPLAPGCAYYEAVKHLDDRQFTDVVLLPSISYDDKENYVLNIVKALLKLDPERRILILTGEKPREPVAGLFPEQCTWIDLYEICSRWELNDIDIITLRIIQAVASESMLHITPCSYVFSLYEKFSPELPNSATFYYFCEPISCVRGARFIDGSALYFISEFASTLTRLVSDHSASMKYAEQRLELDHQLDRATLYAKCETSLRPQALVPFAPKKRLLWASEFGYQNRPELLEPLAVKLLEYDSEISLDIYVRGVLPESAVQTMALPNVHYRGGFERFDELKTVDYDALIYTSRFDGIPNSLLECMSSGLLIVAPDVGGLNEIVQKNRTGLLLNDNADDCVMADHYVHALKEIYENYINIDQIRRDALSLVLERHSEDVYLAQVKEIFNLADEEHV